MQFSFPTIILKAALLFISKDVLRGALMGIQVRAEGDRVVITATDGHRLLSLMAPMALGEEAWCDIVLPAPSVKQFLTGIKKRDWFYPTCLSFNDGIVELQRGLDSIATRFTPLTDPFPNWRALVHAEGHEDVFPDFSMEMAVDFTKASRMLTNGFEEPFFRATSKHRAIQVFFPTITERDIEGFGLLMPKIRDESTFSPPGWAIFTPAEPETAEAA